MARLAGVEVVGAGHHVVGGLVGVQIDIAVIALGRLADHFLAPGMLNHWANSFGGS
ncbi:MAG: hypothetical protein ACLRYE_03100 [Gemmiger formicilis]|uniref:hypothetical protein n=1 Tax=Gemmiger formicilis TaxID=745368 RepID=UPI0039A3D439